MLINFKKIIVANRVGYSLAQKHNKILRSLEDRED